MEDESWTWTIEARLEAPDQETMEKLVEYVESQLDNVSLESSGIEGASITDWRVSAG